MIDTDRMISRNHKAAKTRNHSVVALQKKRKDFDFKMKKK